MKNLFLYGLVGLFSVVSIVEVQAGRRCGGKKSRKGGCNTCYVQQCHTGGSSNGCQTQGGYSNGGGYNQGQGGYGGAGVEAGANVGPAGAGAGVQVNP